jgi:hypothetical protein
MAKWNIAIGAFVGAVVCAGLFTLGAVGAQQGRTNTQALTALDYIEIQQLNARYGFAIDYCTNNGYDYADLYTPDGTFTSGRDGSVYKGREQLAEAAGGAGRGCKKLEGGRVVQSHTIVNLVIEPTAEGATGKSYLVYPGVKGERGGPDNNGHVGGYQDVYVKTPNGWRIKSRIHVHPPQVAGAYSGVPNSKRTPAAAPAR